MYDFCILILNLSKVEEEEEEEGEPREGKKKKKGTFPGSRRERGVGCVCTGCGEKPGGR